jgi:hypothetical protein
MMIVVIQSVEQEFTKNGAEYRKVTGVDGNGKQTTKNVFDNLQDKWGLLQENATLEFKMEKKGQFWNVADITPSLNPPNKPEVVEESMPPQDWKPEIPVDESSVRIRSMCVSYAKDMADNGMIPIDSIGKVSEYMVGYVKGKLTGGELDKNIKALLG